MPVLHPPSRPLAAHVDAIRYETGTQTRTTRELVLPSASISLWVNLNQDAFRTYGGPNRDVLCQVPGSMLAGPGDHASAIEIEAGRSHICVDFALGGAASFFAAPLSATRNELVPLEDLWGRDGALLREQLLEATTPGRRVHLIETHLMRHIAVGPLPDPAIRYAGAALGTGVSVAEVAAQLGMLPRTFRRRFVRQVGMTPKRYARVRRLQRLVHAIQGTVTVNWADVAAQHGYCDQAHLVDDFRDLVGVTPGTYLDQRIGGPTHLRLPLAAG